jgi:two-component system, OmpR family, response regulator
MRVLLVEDDAKMAGLLRRGLVEEGLIVEVAGTGDDALAMAAARRYDAILLDVRLPGTDGLAVCRRLRESGRQPAVLMLTARDGDEDRLAGFDAGADDYMTKPFSFGELLAHLRALASPEGSRPVSQRDVR